MLQFISLANHTDQHLISLVLLNPRRLASQKEASGCWVCLGEKLHLHHAGSHVVAPVSLTIKMMYSRLIQISGLDQAPITIWMWSPGTAQ